VFFYITNCHSEKQLIYLCYEKIFLNPIFYGLFTLKMPDYKYWLLDPKNGYKPVLLQL